ncbi:hypothetical protein MNBD_GAMMA12-2062 [hydrothermal vent metagenome]|uniref:Uncharacterized protein n=1 Tax=hydrothermal vent metagenome TaxID=652676 RepID=A0A3B0YTJ0_9ZZZZ
MSCYEMETVQSLESQIIDRIINLVCQDRWEIFIQLDSNFVSIACKGPTRLERSQLSGI